MKTLTTLLACFLTLSACGSPAADTTTTAQTIAAPPSTQATTTTVDEFDVTITGDGPGNLLDAVTAAYLFAGQAGPEPSATAGFTAHLSGGSAASDLSAEYAFATAELTDGWVSVGTSEDDIVLATSPEGETWTLVGGRLNSMGLAPFYGDEAHQLFIIGSDARTKENPLKLRADSLHIITVAPDGSSASIVGLPRDSYVETPSGSKRKFTNVMSGNGPELVVETAELLTDLDFDGYMVTGFAGFVRLVNDFGGFEIDIPFAMAEPKSDAYFSAGRQMIDGFQALAFARNRTLKGGDFTRSFHHGVIMQWGLAAVQSKGALQIPHNLSILDEHTFTDLTPEKRLLVMAALFELDPFEIPNMVVDGTAGMAGSASVVFLNDPAFETFADLADGRLDNVDE